MKKDKKVLIIEDDVQISKVYKIQLEKENIEAILIKDGEKAMEVIEKEKPDLIILDLMMPKRDGFWVLENIKKNKEYINIPILVISNLGQSDDKKRSLDLGATEHLVKIDQSIKDIVQKIKGYLEI